MAIPAYTATINHLSPPPPPPPPSASVRTTINNSSHTPIRHTTASWTSSIAHLCKKGQLSKALSQFNLMRESGIEPNHITLVTLFSAFADFPSRGSSLAPPLHAYARKLGCLEVENVMVGTALIDMYSKLGDVGIGRLVFDHMGSKNKITWNSMINGYMRNGEFESGFELFDEMPDRDVVSWTVMIDGFVKKQRYEDALELFREMQLYGIEPDFVTIVSVLSAIAGLGTLGLGLWVHRFVMQRELRYSIRINNSLIDMYCRCGCVELACQVFNTVSKRRNLVTWNSIIVGLAYNAFAKKALDYFHAMQKDGFNPDSVSFTGALTACSHAGLVDKGLNLFKDMQRIYRITPTIEHYGCLVDLYSRAGRLKEALRVIHKMPMKPNEVVLGSLLAACRKCADVELAERLMKYIYELDPGGDFNYVLLSNIYASKGSWLGANDMRMKMKARGIKKKPGVSSIEVSGRVHEFVAGDKSHVDAEWIYAMLESLSGELSVFNHGLEVTLQESYCGMLF